MDITHKGGITITKLSPQKFVKLYLEAKREGYLSVKDIMEYMGIKSSSTYYRYWKNEDIKNKIEQKSKKSNTVSPIVSRELNHAEDILEVSYKLHKKGIKEAMDNQDWEKARRLSIKALQIVRSEGEYKRMVINIAGDVNITEQTNIQVSNKVQSNINQIYTCLCEDCKRKVKEL